MNSNLAPEKTLLKYLLILILIFMAHNGQAQYVPDSVAVIDPQALIAEHPYFNFDGEPLRLTIEERKTERSESIFYFIVGLVLFFALMRLIFYKYISTMFTLFFRATLRQQQLKEQMLQAPLPALLMNIFFVVTAAAYCALLTRYINMPVSEGFWNTFLYAMLVIAGIYLGKFIILSVVGWIFGINNVTVTYLFIVFLANKMLAVFLLPFVVLLAFPTSYIVQAVLMLSYVVVAGMYLYRSVIAYRPLRSEIKLSRLHFFLYLCAFEIAPLLLIYKVLLNAEVSSL